jgi:hypothetical protein
MIITHAIGKVHTIDSTNDLRIGIATSSALRSLSFTVSRSGEETYLACRHFPGSKHSFHKSGIHRYAEHKSSERAPTERTTLRELRVGRYWTIARVLFTGTPQATWSDDFGRVPKKLIHLTPPRRGRGKLISLGLVPHHPNDHPATRDARHRGVLKITEGKFLVITEESIPYWMLIRHAFELHAPHGETSTYCHREMKGDTFVYLQHFRTKMNTYFYWAHHGIPLAAERYWFERSSLASAFTSAHMMQMVGYNVGYGPLSDFFATAPDRRNTSDAQLHRYEPEIS